MSKLSIYDDAWTRIVFEGKNQEYGAYQLRHESPKTTAKALLITLSLTAIVVSIPFLLSSFGNAPVVKTPTIPMEPSVHPVEIQQELQQKAPAAKPATPFKTNAPQLSWHQLIVTQNPDPKTEVPTNNQFNSQTSAPTGTPSGTGSPGPDVAPTGTGTETAPEAPKGPLSMMAVDVKPQFPGGMEGFYRYISKNFKAPEPDGLEGTKLTVLVYFVIETDGTLSDIKVTRNPGYGMEKEAIRVLQSLRIKWQPGLLGGKPVRTAYSMPITVRTE